MANYFTTTKIINRILVAEITVWFYVSVASENSLRKVWISKKNMCNIVEFFYDIMYVK